ncbi:pleckstrin homology domain-containing family M member 3 [Callorhinchus milii]|uniref:pleckstrin homology domain-containing family M member 3 n=1 Tax=Callorhinchus milii TaxID=7868 RepID=UPI001C3F8F6D|nr:pleckstrin homology domain-containing family M member 3 [Callorhinchus milii]XP_007888786.2 pleckstrin homology domain-containing family M member 3 [Callorhinchus milii]XP_007888787.2 pleckstrin homology domain-containing family M member 3 [Callorhinchus milii]XP_007888788.2 pleckstrin homology domain-containing family M member 3 [Callorhinchus milii]
MEEALEADDISPALEATEEFFLFSGIDDRVRSTDIPQREVYGIQEVPVVIGHEVLKTRGEKLQGRDGTSAARATTETRPGGGGPGSQPVRVSGRSLCWSTGSTDFEDRKLSSSCCGVAYGKRNASAKSWSGDRPELCRSQSDIVPSQGQARPGAARAHPPTDSSLTLSIPSFSTSLNGGGEIGTVIQRKSCSQIACQDVLKKGNLARKPDHISLWEECYVELCSRELRVYSLDNRGNWHLCKAYYLRRCQSITVPATHDARVLEVLFSNGAWLQLQARSQQEAEDWRQNLLERVIALRPLVLKDVEHATCNTPPLPPNRDPRTFKAEAALSSIWLGPLPLHSACREGALRIGTLRKLTPQNNWKSYTFILSRSQLKHFGSAGREEEAVVHYKLSQCLDVHLDVTRDSATCFKVIFPEEVLFLMADAQREAQEWTDAIAAAMNATWGCGAADHSASRVANTKEVGSQRSKRYSVTSSFLSLLTVIAVEKGLTAQSFRCAGCRRLVGLSYGKAKVCAYSGWYYCQVCHVDDVFLIPARLVHNWDITKHKVSKQAKEFLEYVYEEPLIDIQHENPNLYEHVEALAAVLRVRQQLKSLRAYLFSCRASVAEDLRRRIFPREYILQHVHLYSLADLQQVFEGKLTPFLLKVNKFASAHVYSCSLCSQKGFICEICSNGQVIYPFEGTVTKRCEACGAVFHAECKSKALPCPRCVHRELQKRPRSFWRNLDLDENFELCNAFELAYPST